MRLIRAEREIYLFVPRASEGESGLSRNKASRVPGGAEGSSGEGIREGSTLGHIDGRWGSRLAAPNLSWSLLVTTHLDGGDTRC